MPPTVPSSRLAQEVADLWLAEDGDREIRFLANLFTQVSLPYKDPGDDLRAWGRRNGDIVLTVIPGAVYNDDNQTVTIGYPYGTMPRLLLAWLSTEAVRTRSAKIELGDSLTGFLHELGMAATGGKNGTIVRLRTQMNRLFRANMSIQVKGDADRDTGGSVTVASRFDLWWGNDGGQSSLLPSTVTLTQEFFHEVCRSPVPLDLGALRKLRGSSQRLDLYSWLTYRMSYLRKPTLIPWESLRSQFGANFKDTRQGRSQFKRDFIRHLEQVLRVYPQARVEVTDTGLILYPSPTHVPFRGRAALASAEQRPPR
jgi:hypothetical protein